MAPSATAEEHAPGEQRLGTAAIIMVVATFGSAVVGLVRTMVYSREFGTAPAFNAYLQAFCIPDLTYFLLAGGVLRAGFIPVFTRLMAQGQVERAWRTFSVTLYVMAGFGLVVVALGMLLAPWLAPVVAPGLAPQYRELCAVYMRTMFPAQLFFIVGGLLMGALNAQKHFTTPAWGPIAYNLVVIAGALASHPIAVRAGITEPFPQLVHRLWVLSLFVVLGAAVGNLLLQLPPLARMGARLHGYFNLRDEGLRDLLLLALPVILGLAVSEINFVVTKAIGTLVSDRAVALLEYPNRLVKLPPRIFGAGLAIALLPALATHFARNRMEAYRRDLSLIMRSTLFLTVPSTVIFLGLGVPIIRLFFEGKQFGPGDTLDAAQVLWWSAFGIAPLSMQYIVARGFYALHETKTPLWVGLATGVINLGLSLAVYRPFGVAGLSAVGSFAALFNAAMLTWLLRRKIGPMEGGRMGALLGKLAVPSVVLGLVCWAGSTGVVHWMGTQGTLAKTLACLGPMAVGAAAFLGLCALFRVEEMQSAINLVAARFRRTARPSATESEAEPPLPETEDVTR